MTAIAPDADRLREIEVDMREAWNTYSERLRDLAGEEYERSESESWAELQTELRRLERERDDLIGPAA